MVCDPHELANVLGADGAHWLLDASSGLPLRVYVMAPSCVPASALESPRGPLGTEDMASILRRGRALGVAEVMDFPSVIAGDPDVLAKVALHPHVDGHAPGVTGRALDAYAAAGIRSDHEATTWEEALEKRRRGLWVLLREASNARNLLDLLELVRRFGPEHCAFCTDDREPDMLVREGHIDAMCRAAVGAGIAPEDALLMATLHPARCHRLADLGAIAPGFRADLVVLEDLESFRAETVIAGGAVAARDGAALPFDAPAVPAWVRDSIRLAPLGDDALDLGPAARARARDRAAGRAADHRGGGRSRPRSPAAASSPTPARDLAKLAVVERHHATGRVGVGLVRGFGLRARRVRLDGRARRAQPRRRRRRRREHARLRRAARGARRRDRGRRRAARSAARWRCRSRACCRRRRPRRSSPRLDELVALLREQGVTGGAPFMTLSFLALSVIPELKLTDHGLVDVAAARVVPLAL